LRTGTRIDRFNGRTVRHPPGPPFKHSDRDALVSPTRAIGYPLTSRASPLRSPPASGTSTAPWVSGS